MNIFKTENNLQLQQLQFRDKRFSTEISFWSQGTLLIIWKICGTPKLMIQKTNKNLPRRNKYILENILLDIFKFYILKYIIKFLQSYDNNRKKIQLL